MELLRDRKGWSAERPTNWPAPLDQTATRPRPALPSEPVAAEQSSVANVGLALFDLMEAGAVEAVAEAAAKAEAEAAAQALAASQAEAAVQANAAAQAESVAQAEASAQMGPTVETEAAVHETAPLTTESLDNAAELRLDTSAVAEGTAELSVSGLSLDDVHADAAHFAGPRSAVVFDPERPVFRRRSQPYQRSVEETLQLERSRERRDSALIGAVVFLVLVAAIPSPSSIFLLYSAVVGGCVGAAAQEMRGGVEVWVAGSLMGAAALLPFAEGRVFFVLAAALVVSGGIVGFIRNRT